MEGSRGSSEAGTCFRRPSEPGERVGVSERVRPFKPSEASTLVEENVSAAKEAGLHYVADTSPGVRRERRGKGFRFRDAAGRILRDVVTLDRVRRLAIPPAWEDVWICPRANGHIQATGRDVRGRKQYRYHEDWRATRDATKFERMIAFGRALPRIRRQVGRDLRRRGLDREKVLAAIVQLLESTHIRVGNEEYARENHSFGLSSLRDRHVEIRGGTMRFHFAGKSGKNHDIELHAPRLAKVVKAAQEVPGQELFQYLDEAGQRHRIKSEDVNDYLRKIAGEEFSAKDFRTWAGTVLAARALRGYALAGDKPTKRNLTRAIERVAADLGNTPTICRKCYIHPAVMDAYLGGGTIEVQRAIEGGICAYDGWRLRAEETALLRFLQRKLRRPKREVSVLLAKSISKTRSRREDESAKKMERFGVAAR